MWAAVIAFLLHVCQRHCREVNSNSVSNVVETINKRVFKCLVSAIVERKCTVNYIVQYENRFFPTILLFSEPNVYNLQPYKKTNNIL